ncbi:unnamed protein product, partial [Iphiclides podalirius]
MDSIIHTIYCPNNERRDRVPPKLDQAFSVTGEGTQIQAIYLAERRNTVGATLTSMCALRSERVAMTRFALYSACETHLHIPLNRCSRPAQGCCLLRNRRNDGKTHGTKHGPCGTP